MQRDQIREELDRIKKSNEEGLLKAEEVVEFARNPTTALHDRFTWDDSAAARQYRLQKRGRSSGVTSKLSRTTPCLFARLCLWIQIARIPAAAIVPCPKS